MRIVAAPRDVWDNYDRDHGGEIEVTEFLVHDVDPLEILSQMTHMFELKMLIRGLSGDQVRVKAFLTCRRSRSRTRISGRRRSSGAVQSLPACGLSAGDVIDDVVSCSCGPVGGR